MIRVNRILVSMLLSGPAALMLSAASYELDLSRGSFPGGVETENLNGVVPDQSVYKHGYVTTGWTVDRLDKRGYVALSPTYHASEAACENLLTLPELEIEEGNTLCWEARSVYRHFPESYRVMAYPEDGGEPILLLEVESESYFWKNRGVSLEALSGRKVKFVFVCTSKSGYMLALTGVKVGSNEIPAENPESSDADYAIDPDFIRALVVDKGTGMWCTNCPEGETVIENLTERFGSRLIVLNTHVQDVLANNPYWEKLEYYSVPRMMLNRIRATEGGNANKFTDYYDKASSFGIRMDAPVEIAGKNMKVNAQVRVSEDIDNPDGRYSVGYVITGNFHDADNVRYQQKNNCTQPAYGAYYFLPSTIPSALMFYDDVTLSYETAFTGIEGSLPESLRPGETYNVEWECEAPKLLANPEDARIVAFVIDTVTGELMNAKAMEVAAESAVHETLTPISESLFSIDASGIVKTSLLPGEAFNLEMFTTAGVKVWSEEGNASGNDSFRLPDAEGLIIVRLSAERGSSVIKFLR